MKRNRPSSALLFIACCFVGWTCRSNHENPPPYTEPYTDTSTGTTTYTGTATGVSGSGSNTQTYTYTRTFTGIQTSMPTGSGTGTQTRTQSGTAVQPDASTTAVPDARVDDVRVGADGAVNTGRDVSSEADGFYGTNLGPNPPVNGMHWCCAGTGSSYMNSDGMMVGPFPYCFCLPVSDAEDYGISGCPPVTYFGGDDGDLQDPRKDICDAELISCGCFGEDYMPCCTETLDNDGNGTFLECTLRTSNECVQKTIDDPNTIIVGRGHLSSGGMSSGGMGCAGNCCCFGTETIGVP